ncbi:TPA: hypothetical protein HA246_06220 [Candidatus Woesearchaeota archaeon]|nr:hypothetical protein [Candidatus Woesearchaeota archaeon]
MRKLENYLKLEKLEASKSNLVPSIFSENYYNILRTRIQGKKLDANERYYYSHFIRKKVEGMIELFELDESANGRGYIRKERIAKANRLLKKYSRKHKNMKILISGSFLYNERYNDIDIFIISKYDKEDYRKENVHVNYLPADVERTLFFQSVYAVSISNFKAKAVVEEDFDISDILHLYEVAVLLIMQKDDYLQELRDLILRLEYISNKVILNSMQLKIITDKIVGSKNPIKLISKYLIAKVINAYNVPALKATLARFIKKNSLPGKKHEIYPNWKIYIETYKEAIEVVA